MREKFYKACSVMLILCGAVCIAVSLVCYILMYIEDSKLYQQYKEFLPTFQTILQYSVVAEEVTTPETEEVAVVRDDRYRPATLYIGDRVVEEEEEIEEPITIKTIVLDGQHYIGMIAIPSIDLALPIHETWTDAKLDTAPCVYQGSLQGEDLIVGGHNTRAHFSLLHTLPMGSEAIISDADGVEYTFVLQDRTVISEMEVEFLRDIGDYELTLFTCDADSRKRVVLRWHLQ